MPIYSLGEKKPQLPENELYWVAPDAHVIGDVVLGKDVGIWFGSVLRGDNDLIKIGNETNIQENTIIHVDPNTPVKIGNNCLVGAGALVTENKEFPDGMLIIGSPAKAVRELSPEMIKDMTRSSKHYVDNFKKFIKELEEIK